MALLQVIPFHSGRDYLAGFLQQLADKSGLNASIAFDGKMISLEMDESDPASLQRFSEAVSTDLPHSLFMGTVYSDRSDNAPRASRLQSNPADLPLCPACLRSLFDPESPDYLDQNLVCRHYGASVATPSDALPDINAAADEILAGKPVTLGGRTYRTAYVPGDTLLLCDPSAAGDLLLLSQGEMQALFAIEKPRLKVALKDDALKTTVGKNVLRVKLFDDAPSTLLAKLLRDRGVRYLFISETDPMEVMVYKERIHIVRPGALGDTPSAMDADPVINHHLNIADEFGIKDISSIGVDLESSGAWQFIHRSAKVNKPVIRLNPVDPANITQRLATSSAARERLMENFKNLLPERYEALRSLETDENATLFDLAAAIIGCEKGFEGMNDASLAFAGNGGLKVDVKFKEGDFDSLSFLASIISFKVAGVENALLTFSVFESLADLVTETLTELKSRLKTNDVILFGDLMTNTPLYSRILKNLGPAAPLISNQYAFHV